jgi:alpha/beta superfamily hydrolase
MIPTYINGCFAVLHPGNQRRGVLICGPVGDEALNCYRSLVFLAEALAAAGYPTLRLHYHGTGDSSGEVWQHDIDDAVTWLHDHCDVDAITVIGVRIGAAFVSQAAHNITTIDSLVLILPIAGRRFLHELTIAGQITQRVWRTSNKVDDGIWFEAHGVRLDHASRDALKSLDVRPPSDKPVLQIDAATTEDISTILRDSHLAAVPHATIAQIVGWVTALPTKPQRTNAPPSWPGVGQPAKTLNLAFATESPVRFGPHDGLFGIMCRPNQQRDAPPILLVNTSANPRAGNARIAVDLARRLAAEGIASLRMDGAGMGDSAPATGELGSPYSEAATNDVRHAVELLHQQTGEPAIVLGICSGAYHALQAGLLDARVGGLVLVNLQRFVWREGDPPDAIRRDALRPTQFYLRHILDWQSWRRLLLADFDVLNLIRVLSVRVLLRIVASLDPVITLIAGGATRVGRVRRSVRTLGLRAVPILYVLGNNDPGIEELATYFGADGRRLRQQSGLTFRMLADSDHTLSSHRVRTALIEEVVAWINQTHRPIAAISSARAYRPIVMAGSGGVALPRHDRLPNAP